MKALAVNESYNEVYDRTQYTTQIDYHLPLPLPVLSEANRQWIETLLAHSHVSE
ncbi:DUF4058 family protein [Scytonema sp. NUACC21]